MDEHVRFVARLLEGDYAAWARSSQKAYGQNLKRLATAFKKLLDKPLDKITGLDVERWRAGEVERGLSNQTINRDISSIKASFNRAVDLGDIAGQSAREDQEGARR